MEHATKIAAIIEDLVKINNDRIEGYEKAATQTAEGDLKQLFETMIADSRQNATELNTYLRDLGEERESDSTFAGKLYRTWMDVKVTFGGGDRRAILATCEYGEDAAQKSYNTALEQDFLPADIRLIISNQRAQLRRSHDQIRHLRDLETVNKS
ncbi:PA2169 family four-helix-bundle protein [Chitinophaga deserti]|uniref:PA2169 family four-helix-bundle protein n=1 Tax=Chitinophaga deserti TaxID=2164099 RepID=UPI000D6B2449|nr:PA2169 family four-helix-bundle protein [Chitinophaga deserti]